MNNIYNILIKKILNEIIPETKKAITKGNKISPGSKLLTLKTFDKNKNNSEKPTDNQLKNINSDLKQNTFVESIPTKTFNQINNNVQTIYTSPSVRRFARKLGCNLSLVSGSGPKGRILKEDVDAKNS